MDFDSVLDHVGHFGKFQLLVMILAGVCQIFGGMHMKAGRFLTLNPMFQPNLHRQRCFIDNCDNVTTQYMESFVNFTIPNVNDDGQTSLSQCEHYLASGSSCQQSSFTNIIVPCDRFVYDHSEFEETAVSKFNIVCKKSWSGASSQTIFMAGVLLGSAGFGMIADKFGRKTVILTASVILLSSSIGTAFSPNFNAFTALRFVTAFAVCGLFQTGYIIAVEFVGTSKRLWCANIMQMVFAVGELILGLIAYLVPNWRKLELLISIPAAIMLFYYWLLPESVRWLISQGKLGKAKETILKAAKWNGKVVPDHLLQSAEYTNIPSYAEPNIESLSHQRSEGLMSLFKAPTLRKWSLNIFFNWIVNAMVYYGLSLSASHLSGNTYLNFAVLAAVEIPSVFLSTIVLSQCGRRWVLCAVMVIGGLACGSTIFIPQYLGWLATTFAVIGKSAIAASFAVIYIYSAEIYPTAVRSTGIGLSSMFSRIGAMIAPVINELRKVYRPLPMIVFSIASIIAGLLALYLPETHNRQLPETIEEAERFGIGRVNDILNVPRSRLLSRFGSMPNSHRSAERRLAEEGRRLLASAS